MNNASLKVGYWASFVAGITFIIHPICFTIILLINPLFIWTNFEDYIKHVQNTNQIFANITMFAMIVFGASFVIILCSIEEIAQLSKKYYAKIAKLFGIGFCVLNGAYYFIQISSIRIQINAGHAKGLEQFIYGNPYSAMSSMNMFGWTILLGISCIFAGLAFGETKKEKIIKYALLTNGIILMIGLVGHLLNITYIVLICMNLGTGSATLISIIFLCKFFTQLSLHNCNDMKS